MSQSFDSSHSYFFHNIKRTEFSIYFRTLTKAYSNIQRYSFLRNWSKNNCKEFYKISRNDKHHTHVGKILKAHIPLQNGFTLKRNVYGQHDKLGVTQILSRVGGNANFCVFRYQHVGIPNTKLWRWGSKPMRGPNGMVLRRSGI